ncbi:hypothetical protein [Clostridium oceanicum]|uniref:Phage tail tape measure protein n=1 Tax=Clostridium oceanicum TaxID=1543 RepID=A0ABN1JBY7_9CLOT
MASGVELAPLVVNVRMNLNNFNVSMTTIEQRTTEVSNNAESKLSKIGKKLSDIGSKMTSKVSLPMLKVGSQSFKLASDLNESVDKANKVFKNNADVVNEWSKTSVEKMGITQTGALEMASNFGNMGSAMGLSSEKSMQYSMSLTELASDMASFNNISIDRAKDALTGIYTGETKALQSLGITMSETNLQHFAESQGIKKKIKDMTEAEKVQLRYNYVMSETKDRQGDFSRNSDEASNATKIFFASIKELGATIGETLIPILTPMINKANDIIKSFSGMSDETKGFIVKAGLFTIALGPVLSILGKGIGLFTGITGAIGATGVATAGAGAAAGGAAAGLGALGSVALPLVGTLAAVAGGAALYVKNNELMNGSCLKSREEIGKVGSVLEVLHGDIALTADQMDKMNIKHKEWSSKISPQTQKALTETSDKIANFNFELRNSNGLDGVISKKQIDGLKKRSDSLFNETIQKIKQRSPQVQKQMGDSFKADDGVLDKNEKVLMNFLNKSQDKQIKEVQGYQKQINDIYAKAANQNRDLKEDEIKTIEQLTQKIGNVSLNNTVKNNQELIAAKADFNARIKNLDMNGLSKLLSEKAKARDKEMKSIKLNYDKQIETLKLYRPKMSKEEQKICDEKIKKLEGLKTKSIKKEKEKYQGFLKTAMEKYPQLIDYVDTSNGKIMSDEEQNNYKRLTRYSQHMQGMMGINKTGYYNIKDTTTGQMHQCYVEVDEASGRIVGSWDRSTGEIYGNPIKAREDINQDLKDGVPFENIKGKYNGVWEKIYKKAIEIQSEKNPNVFDWVSNLWEDARRYVIEHPLQALGSIVKSGLGIPGYAYNGLEYVPFDGYMARLHKGERVLTAEENEVYKKGSGDIKVTNNFYSRMESPYEVAKATKRSIRELQFS